MWKSTCNEKSALIRDLKGVIKDLSRPSPSAAHADDQALAIQRAAVQLNALQEVEDEPEAIDANSLRDRINEVHGDGWEQPAGVGEDPGDIFGVPPEVTTTETENDDQAG
jgi:hypothetical protein